MHKFIRYPRTANRSLQPKSTADDYILNYLKEHSITSRKPIIYHDRFGYLSCHLHPLSPSVILTYKSQETAIKLNLSQNKIPVNDIAFVSPLTPIAAPTDLGIIRIPKSLELFQFYLSHIHQSLSDKGEVICSFMTRHFSPQMLSIAETYFESVNQSLAWKKSRLLILKGKKDISPTSTIRELTFEDLSLKQYLGVFSSNHIDYASQLLIPQLVPHPHEQKILDVGTGNGIFGVILRQHALEAELHLTDDFSLAIESAKLNLAPTHTVFHFTDTLTDMPDDSFDLVVSNPPFHFGHEINIEIALSLFKDIHRILTPKGRFLLVYSKHLNFKSHLSKQFFSVSVISENDKFEVCECLKTSH